MEEMEAVVTSGMIKAAILGEVKGKVMIKRDREFKGLEANNIWSFFVYHDNPCDKVAIRKEITALGGRAYNQTIVGGAYGYRIRFRLGEDE